MTEPTSWWENFVSFIVNKSLKWTIICFWKGNSIMSIIFALIIYLNRLIWTSVVLCAVHLLPTYLLDPHRREILLNAVLATRPDNILGNKMLYKLNERYNDVLIRYSLFLSNNDSSYVNNLLDEFSFR